MEKTRQFYIVDQEVLPEVFLKVMEVKKMLQEYPLTTVQEATELVGISRSSFYKYKDYIEPFREKGIGDRAILLIYLKDQVGQLSEVLTQIVNVGANILTINQMMPINEVAMINICIGTVNMEIEIGALLEHIRTLQGVQNVELLARE